MKNCFYLFFFTVVATTVVNATHIVGGEIYYDCIGNNKYQITLKIYRDCLNGQAPFDDPNNIFGPGHITVYNVNGVLIRDILLHSPQVTNLPFIINDPCFLAPPNICVEEGVYTDTITLPPIPGGYSFAYQRCCRNNTILNLVNPGDIGATYTVRIPDTTLAICNNSPRFNNFPPIAICINSALVFDHSATDPDSDSLVYSFCDPFQGLSPSSPGPITALPPPYTPVPFLFPYTGAHPMSSSPTMTINSQTGMIKGTPNLTGQWVVGVCVQEYRKGKLLGESKRDFQFNVTNCPENTVSSIPSQQLFCFGFKADFLNSSTNAGFYHWDFGDPSAANDTSNLKTPSWTYPGSGTYTVTLIANPGLFCADTARTVFKIDPLLDPKFTPPPAQCLKGNQYTFTAAGSFQGFGISSFSWNFGTDANPINSSLPNPPPVAFDAAGSFPVTLKIAENGCTKSYTDNVIVHPMPIADFDPVANITCSYDWVTFNDMSVSSSSLLYRWDFGNGEHSSEKNPQSKYTIPGSYDVSLRVTSTFGCTDSIIKSAIMTVNPLPKAMFEANPSAASIFEPHIHITDQSIDAVKCQFLLGDGNTSDSCNFTHTYSDTGTYVITQIVTNIYGCKDTFELPIHILPEYRYWIPNSFTPFNGDGINDFFMPVLMGARDYEFDIFDRWGNKLFQTGDPKTGWNGTFEGKKCEEDIYVYRVTYTDVVEGKKYHQAGIVTLIR